jgi:cell division inhibitor SepF
MANAFKRVANYLGLVDDEDDLQPVVEVEQPMRASRAVRPVPSATNSSNQSSAPVWAAPAAKVNPANAAQNSQQGAVQTELPVMDQIFTIHPRFYNEARTVGEKYRLGQPVLMNLSDMEESERKRLVDFASGLVFGHFGSIERVTSKVFLLTPPNVRVSTEGKVAATEASFFNQS